MLFCANADGCFTYVMDRGAPDCRWNGHYNCSALRKEAIAIRMTASRSRREL